MKISLFSLYDSILFFVMYSFLGWLLEISYAYYAHKKFINRGFLNGPFCPIYGFGALIIVICLDNFKNNVIILFILGTLLTSLLEYFTAIILEKAFKTTWWDYTDDAFNIKGRICLLFSIIWGIVSVILVKIINPIVLNSVYSLPVYVRKNLFFIFALYLLIDLVITLKELISLTKMLTQLSNLYIDIKNQIKSKISTNSLNSLKENYSSLLNKFSPNHIRLMKAFPTMKFKGFNNLMNDIRNKLNSIINN